MKDMCKVRAHQGGYPGEPPAERLRRLGNAWADESAKAGAAMQPRPTDAARGFLSCQWSDALVACKVIGTTTSMWPDAAEMTGRLRRPPTRDQRRQAVEANRDRRARLRKSRMDAQRVKLGTHMWAKVGSSTLRCVACLAWHRWDMEVCPGLPPSWSKWLRTSPRRYSHSTSGSAAYTIQR